MLLGSVSESATSICMDYTLREKSFCILSFSGPYFPAFGLNTKIYRVSLRIQSESGKIWTRKNPNTDTFHAVIITIIIFKVTYSRPANYFYCFIVHILAAYAFSLVMISLW